MPILYSLFFILQDADEKAEDTEEANNFIRQHTRFKKVLMGMARMVLARENVIRRAAGLPTVSPTRQQISNFILNALDQRVTVLENQPPPPPSGGGGSLVSCLP